MIVRHVRIIGEEQWPRQIETVNWNFCLRVHSSDTAREDINLFNGRDDDGERIIAMRNTRNT